MANNKTINGKYLYYKKEGSINPLDDGVGKKILAQVKILNSDYISCELQLLPITGGKIGQIIRRLPFFPDHISWPEVDCSLDYYYIRRPFFASRQFVKFLSDIKRSNSSTQIVCEIPTYPYDDQLKNFLSLTLLIKDKIHRRKYMHYVDRFTTVSADKCIFEVPTIKMINGIDLSKTAVKRTSVLNEKHINILCAAKFAAWHGVDRLLEGLIHYYSTNQSVKVSLHLLGDGPEVNALKKIVKKGRLESYVKFYGFLNQAQMDKVYNKCSLAVASLGLHRFGLSNSSELKTREYLAKGMPFIHSGKVDVFENEAVDFCLRVEEGDGPVDVEKIVYFHQELYRTYEQQVLISKIRDYAERSVGAEKAMQGVVDYLKEHCSE